MLKLIIVAATLLFGPSAFAQVTYQGSTQPNGTGGYNFYGSNGQFQGSAQPNGTGGYNLSAPTPAPAPGYQSFGPSSPYFTPLGKAR